MSLPSTLKANRGSPAHRFRAGSLRLWLSAIVVLTMWVGTAVSLTLDYRREYIAHTDDVFQFLRQQAFSLELIREHVPDRTQFAHYVNAICERINERISPGHHILVIGPDGEIIASTTAHSGKAVENALLSADPRGREIIVEGHHLVYFRFQGKDGWTIITAQYLDYVYSILEAQLRDRLISAGLVALVLTFLIFVLMHSWVLRPVAGLVHAARAWAGRDFAAKAPVTGPDDMRLLTSELNSMAERLQDYQQQQIAELDRARQIQNNLLPRDMPAIPGVSFASLYRPANHVAGDLYDVFKVPSGKVAVLALDVSGHGLSAALMTGVVKMALHRRLAEFDNLSYAMQLVNSDLLACVTEGQFVTACVGLWDPATMTWTWCAAGHPGGLLLSDHKASSLDTNGPLLGVFPNASWKSDSVLLHPGDRLILYTDGVTEAGAPGEQLGTAGLEKAAQRTSTQPLRDQITVIADQAARLCSAHQCDDITLVALEVLPTSPSPK